MVSLRKGIDNLSDFELQEFYNLYNSVRCALNNCDCCFDDADFACCMKNMLDNWCTAVFESMPKDLVVTVK